MSRIGNQPVPLPDGVKATLADGVLRIRGPLGELEQAIKPRIRVLIHAEKKLVRVERADEDRDTKALHGLTRNLIVNMVVGVTQGYHKALEIIGVGYSAKAQGKELVLQIGYAHPISVPIPDGVTLDPPEAKRILIAGVGAVPSFTVRMHGCDKQKVGQFAAALRSLKPPDPYKVKGIRYEGEEIRRKAGKAFAAQE